MERHVFVVVPVGGRGGRGQAGGPFRSGLLGVFRSWGCGNGDELSFVFVYLLFILFIIHLY